MENNTETNEMQNKPNSQQEKSKRPELTPRTLALPAACAVITVIFTIIGIVALPDFIHAEVNIAEAQTIQLPRTLYCAVMAVLALAFSFRAATTEAAERRGFLIADIAVTLLNAYIIINNLTA